MAKLNIHDIFNCLYGIQSTFTVYVFYICQIINFPERPKHFLENLIHMRNVSSKKRKKNIETILKPTHSVTL